MTCPGLQRKSAVVRWRIQFSTPQSSALSAPPYDTDSLGSSHATLSACALGGSFMPKGVCVQGLSLPEHHSSLWTHLFSVSQVLCYLTSISRCERFRVSSFGSLSPPCDDLLAQSHTHAPTHLLLYVNWTELWALERVAALAFQYQDTEAGPEA